jgi:hypothetical protein
MFDNSEKKIIGGPITLADDEPVTKYQADSDGRMFWAYNSYEVFYAGERMYLALDEIQRLKALIDEHNETFGGTMYGIND